MNEAKHTPGPWTAWKNGTDVFEGTATVNTESRIVGVGGRIAMCEDCGDEIPREQQEANARLIAAAPCLLEACKNIVAACELTEDAYYDAIDTAINIARAAIARAEGPTK